jgi:hypothetical protein
MSMYACLIKHNFPKRVSHLLEATDKFNSIGAKVTDRTDHTRGRAEEKEPRELAPFGRHDQRNLQS